MTKPGSDFICGRSNTVTKGGDPPEGFMEHVQEGFRLRAVVDNLRANPPRWYWRRQSVVAWEEELAKARASLVEHTRNAGAPAMGGTKRGTYAVDLQPIHAISAGSIARLCPSGTNMAAAANSVAIGAKNQAKHPDAILIGDGLVSDHNGQIKIGTADSFVIYDPPAEEREKFRKALLVLAFR